MSVSSTEDLPKLDMILYGRPAGRNIISYAVEEIKRLSIENRQWQSACKDYTNVLAAQDKEIKTLQEHHKLAVDNWTLEAQTVKQQEDAIHELKAEIKALGEHSAHRTYQVGELRDLLKECKKVMQANSVFRGTLEHKDLSRRISIALKGLTKVKR